MACDEIEGGMAHKLIMECYIVNNFLVKLSLTEQAAVISIIISTAAILVSVLLFWVGIFCQRRKDNKIFHEKKKVICTNIRYMSILLSSDIENISRNILNLCRLQDISDVKCAEFSHWHQLLLNNKFYELKKLHHHRESFEKLMFQIAEYDSKIFHQCANASIYIFNALQPNIEYLAYGLTTHITKEQLFVTVGDYKTPAMYRTISRSLTILYGLEREVKKYSVD